MKNKNINNTIRVLAEDMKKYVEIILSEYGETNPEERKQFLRGISDYPSVIKIEDSGTISMFATKEAIILPAGAYKTIEFLRRIPGYGINKSHRRYRDGEIVNKNTYFKYIRHVIIKGMGVEEFFRDSLLHETMHFCGAGGGKALREGFTELKTRELAQKHGLKASRCGYPKEVDIASRFQRIVGEDIGNIITFARDNRAVYRILRESCGKEVAELYWEIAELMDKEQATKYNHSKFGGIFGFIKKARAYSKLDYSLIYEKISAFEREHARKKGRQEWRYREKEDIGVYRRLDVLARGKDDIERKTELDGNDAK